MDCGSILFVQLGRLCSSVYVDGRDGDTGQLTLMIGLSLVKNHGPLVLLHHAKEDSQQGSNVYVLAYPVARSTQRASGDLLRSASWNSLVDILLRLGILEQDGLRALLERALLLKRASHRPLTNGFWESILESAFTNRAFRVHCSARSFIAIQRGICSPSGGYSSFLQEYVGVVKSRTITAPWILRVVVTTARQDSVIMVRAMVLRSAGMILYADVQGFSLRSNRNGPREVWAEKTLLSSSLGLGRERPFASSSRLG